MIDAVPARKDVFLILSTAPSVEEARRLARGLVEAGLAACVNVIPAMESVYRWQGRVEEAGEALLLVKTTAGARPAVEEFLTRTHSYEVPEVLAIPVAGGSAAYLAWLADSVSEP